MGRYTTVQACEYLALPEKILEREVCEQAALLFPISALWYDLQLATCLERLLPLASTT